MELISRIKIKFNAALDRVTKPNPKKIFLHIYHLPTNTLHLFLLHLTSFFLISLFFYISTSLLVINIIISLNVFVSHFVTSSVVSHCNFCC
ncbi:hypothetical protein QVD17_17743 [Tagetes erecta]|uniref:Uncharacterized protein n=1 Tax=Tagetes erecta TaxID=13708 RepID=A0AAD8KWP0_TARER|nr:hypothetical protein QVD17_17743 [Tagetes erecta]